MSSIVKIRIFFVCEHVIVFFLLVQDFFSEVLQNLTALINIQNQPWYGMCGVDDTKQVV